MQALTDLERHRDWLLGLVELPPSGSVADLGCGRGLELVRLAERHPDPGARFVGFDASESHIEVARSGSRDPRVSFERARLGGPLDLPDAGFDVVLTQDLLECMGDAEGFVDEIARVLKPGGQVVAAHHDWGTQTYAGTDRDRTRRVLTAWAEWKQSWMDHADPWMGRRLHGLFAGSGRFEGRIEARTMINTTFAHGHHGHTLAVGMGSMVKRGLLAADDYEGFLAELHDLARQGRYFWSTTRFAFVGRTVDAARVSRGRRRTRRQGSRDR